ncbi:hypothetical protein [Guptibacillus algicola]|uniref:hypothetical protein n=1 Tax=Guptibacillus algicola TaxID=225844 RepID=UPI001CD3547C|nr:hypothetical protein [Alkalihalobacillus algicola]MCA0987865.1 hypothetical protein [Alkalihalobacillus algicola]
MKQDEKLSYSRLITRTKYFQEKSLELEKELIFVRDHLQMVETKMEELQYENNAKGKSIEASQVRMEELEKELTEAQQKIKTLDDERSRLTVELEKAKKEIEMKQKTSNDLKVKFEALEKRYQGAVSEGRIKNYEQLLTTMQNDINEKELQIQLFKAKVKDYEKRMKYRSKSNEGSVSQPTESTEKLKSLAYFNYSIIVQDKKSFIIRGDLQITNSGSTMLKNPVVCFRFRPAETAIIKGQILTVEQAETRGATSGTQWTFMDSDWMSKARDRGEIWVSPLGDVSIKPGDNMGIENFQIPFKSTIHEPFIVEGFVYFYEQDYKIKTSNQIAISY